ncbi:MAG: dihydroorotate dehydrogenase electron transfer subunit [Oscillibacter sp.]|nr:dihydroorotate dehydrogenase electron transfer subunit [Oscillibacter sp.]
MKSSLFTAERVRALTTDTVELTLAGDTSEIAAPGQFVNIALPGHFLRRPVSVCDWTADRLVLLIRVVGAGTRELAQSEPGAAFDILGGLGNGFDLSAVSESVPDNVILAGGGIGIAPLYGLAKALARQGVTPVAALGFRNRADAFYLDEFRAVGCETLIATEDGSLGERGLVTDLLREHPSRNYVFCCGPLPMLRAVHGLPHLTGGQYSFEARMGCGFGACMGCSMPFRDGRKRVCKEGPVFFREEIVWEQ